MSHANHEQVVTQAKDYYDSGDADNFYFRVWGGEDIHVGWYEAEDEDIRTASRRTVEKMAARIAHFKPGTKALDIGAGYGGSARYLAAKKGYHTICLNLSTVQNERNRQMNLDQALSILVQVEDGSFEDLPFDDQSFDVVWSQDAILHSGRREVVFQEVDRVLKPGGEFIFTDPMQQADVDPAVLQPVLERIHLASMGSVEVYRQYAEKLGWEVVGIDEQPDKLVQHYSSVLRELESREAELAEFCSADYRERMKKGLRHWIAAGEQGALNWGILHFKKPA